jgi:DNA polymerase-3 subunit gamma/tau
MTYQVLARKWRPRDFASLVGQEHVVRALTHALEQQRLHHAYLFTGTRGVGKTTLSRILAKALNCETGITAVPCGVCKACREIDEGRFIDYVEMDAASNRGVDEMAALLERAVYAPVDARFKVYMIDEVHMLTNHAFNAMLKTLEEPPAHVKFILATTDPQKIPVTVLSRCLQFNLKQMPATHIVTHLEKILTDEQIGFETQALRLLARAADGSMRDALSLTDQAIAYAAGVVSEEAIRGMLGALDQSYLIRLLDAIAAADGAGVLAIADEMAARSLSFSVALQDLASLLHRVAWAQHAPASVLDEWPEAAEIRRFAALLEPQDIQLYYQIATVGRSELGVAPDEYAGFTMSLLRMLAFQPGTLGSGSGGSAPAKPGVLPAKVPSTASANAMAAQAAAPALLRGTGAPDNTDHARAAAVPPEPAAQRSQADSAREPIHAAVEVSAHAVATAPHNSAAALAAAAVQTAAPVAAPAPAAMPVPVATPGFDAPLPAQSAAPTTAPAVPTTATPVQAAPEQAHNPARAALDALRNAGLKVGSARRTETTPSRPKPAASQPIAPSGTPPKTFGPGSARASSVAAAAPVAAIAPDATQPPPAFAAEAGSSIAPWDDLPPDDYYPDQSGGDSFEAPVAFKPRAAESAMSAASHASSVATREPGREIARSSSAASAVMPSPGLEPQPVTSAPSVTISLAPLGFDGDWPALAATLPLKGLAQQLAYQSELIGLDGATLKLRAAAPLTDAAQVAKLKTALLEQLGRPVSLEVVAGVAACSAAAVDAAARAVRQREADQIIAQDTFVQALIRDFDARIVPGSIRPIQ